MLMSLFKAITFGQKLTPTRILIRAHARLNKDVCAKPQSRRGPSYAAADNMNNIFV